MSKDDLFEAAQLSSITVHKCDCWKYEYQVCDICQGVTGKEIDNSWDESREHFFSVGLNVTDWLFSADEMKALYRLIQNNWIDRNDDELLTLTARIMRINNDISRRDNQAT